MTLPNPSFEIDVSGWSLVGGATLTRQTTPVWSGAASALLTTGGAANSGVQTINSNNPPQNSTWLATAYVQAHAAGDVGKVVYLQVASLGGTAESFLQTFTLAAGWQPVSVQYQFLNTGHTDQTFNVRQSGAGAAFNVDLDAASMARKLHYLPTQPPVTSQLWVPGVPAADWFDPSDTDVTILINSAMYAGA
jgi:hypothetical protein